MAADTQRFGRAFAALAMLALGGIQAAAAQSVARVDALLSADSTGAAGRLADAMLRDPAVAAAQRTSLGAQFGRFDILDATPAALEVVPGTTAAVARLAAGSVPDALDQLESDLQRRGDASRRLGRGSALRAITELGFSLRGTGPALRATSDDPGLLLLVHQAARDTAAVRETIAAIDGARSRMALRNLPPPLTLAEAELFLGDSAAALTRLVAYESSWRAVERSVSWGAVQNGWLLGRTFLLLADVADARGQLDVADRAYRRVIGLWENGGREVQPAVTRAKRALEGDRRDRGDRGTDARRYLMRARPGVDATVRYDAVLWMQPVVGAAASSRPLARLSFVAGEQDLSDGRSGIRTLQRYDSIHVDMPLLDALGDEGLALRRQIQSAAGTLAATTEADSLGRISRRTLENGTSLPDELRALVLHGVGLGPLGAAAHLPAHAVRVGDSWSDSLALVIPGMGSAGMVKVAATWTLTRTTEVGGRRLGFIALDAASGRAFREGVDRIDAVLSGEVVRDLETGETLRVAASLRATLTTSQGAVTPVRVLLTALREAVARPVLAMR